MGDTWPFGAPAYATWQDTYNRMFKLTNTKSFAATMAAIGTAESSLDWRVVNDTPATGDYSVGIWQINYYGSLRPGRTKEFGTPAHLVAIGMEGQANAALAIALTQGLTAWSTYKSGAYKQYLHGYGGPPQLTPGQGPGIPAPNSPGADSWASQVNKSAGHLTGLANNADHNARLIRSLRR